MGMLMSMLREVRRQTCDYDPEEDPDIIPVLKAISTC